MIESFLQYYDRITNFSAPGYETDEILLFLNNAQDQFIKTRAFGENWQPPAFEDNQKRVADLQLLTFTSSIGVTYTGSSGLYYSTLTGTSYLIAARIKLTRTNPSVTNDWIEAKFIKSEEWNKFQQSSVNVTHHLQPVVWLQDDVLWIQCDSYVTAVHASGLNLTRIKNPVAIAATATENPNFPVHAHQEIVDIAVRQALQVQQDPRWQSQVAEQQIKSE